MPARRRRLVEGSGTNTKAVVEAMVFSAPRSGSGARLDENQCKKLAGTRDLHRRPAAQCDGQGAKEPFARDLQGLVCFTRGCRGGNRWNLKVAEAVTTLMPGHRVSGTPRNRLRFQGVPNRPAAIVRQPSLYRGPPRAKNPSNHLGAFAMLRAPRRSLQRLAVKCARRLYLMPTWNHSRLIGSRNMCAY